MKIWNFLALNLAIEAKKGGKKGKKEKGINQSDKHFSKKITHVIKSATMECSAERKHGNKNYKTGLTEAFVETGCKMKNQVKGVQDLSAGYSGNEESIFWQYFMMPYAFPDVSAENYGAKENCGNNCEQAPLIKKGFANDPDKAAARANNKRYKKAKNLGRRYDVINQNIVLAQEANCFKDFGARRLAPRFANYGFNKGIIQITRNYVQVYMDLDEDKLFGFFSNSCGDNKKSEKGLCPPGGLPFGPSESNAPYEGENIKKPHGPIQCRKTARLMEKRLARLSNLSRREYCKVVRKEPWCYEKDGSEKKWTKNSDEEFGNLQEMYLNIKDQKQSLEDYKNRKENKAKSRDEWREIRREEKRADNAANGDDGNGNKGANDWKDGVNRYDPDAETDDSSTD